MRLFKTKETRKPVISKHYEFSVIDVVEVTELHKVQVLYKLSQECDELGMEPESLLYIQDYTISDDVTSDFITLLNWASLGEVESAHYLDTECVVGCVGTCTFILDDTGETKIILEDPLLINIKNQPHNRINSIFTILDTRFTPSTNNLQVLFQLDSAQQSDGSMIHVQNYDITSKEFIQILEQGQNERRDLIYKLILNNWKHMAGECIVRANSLDEIHIEIIKFNPHTEITMKFSNINQHIFSNVNKNEVADNIISYLQYICRDIVCDYNIIELQCLLILTGEETVSDYTDEELLMRQSFRKEIRERIDEIFSIELHLDHLTAMEYDHFLSNMLPESLEQLREWCIEVGKPYRYE